MSDHGLLTQIQVNLFPYSNKIRKVWTSLFYSQILSDYILRLLIGRGQWSVKVLDSRKFSVICNKATMGQIPRWAIQRMAVWGLNIIQDKL